MAVTSTPTLATILSGVVKTVAATALIGGGTMVLHNAQESAVQREQLAEHDRRISAVEKLGDKLEETNKNVIVLNERLKAFTPSSSR
jgi:hypothetical protein